MKISDLDNYKDAYKIFNILKNTNHPNIILYGSKNIEKTEIIKTVLNTLFNNEKNIINDELNYEYNEYYYYFNMLKIKYSQKKNFLDIIKSIIKSYNYYKTEFNYIIFDNFDKINIIFENYLKVFIEKNSHTTKFIILTSKIDKVIEAIRSRCFCIRLSEINIYDKEIFINKLIKENNINKNSFDISQLLYLNTGEIRNKLLYKLNDYNNIICKKIINFFTKPFNKNLVELKDLSYNIKNSLIDFTELCKLIILHYITEKISNIKLSKIIKEISEMNYLMINCYKDIIFIETLLLSLYNIINE